jgi:murein DD-endopeptidase MepM/ murein hydrolase activator NlpD
VSGGQATKIIAVEEITQIGRFFLWLFKATTGALSSAKTNISNPVYRYNAETCRYEQTKRSWGRTIFYVSGVLVCATMMLIGILLLHDLLIDSENEIKLRTENSALKRNQRLVLSELEPVEAKLVSLSEKDQQLHNKFFGQSAVSQATEHHDHSAILLFSPADYPATLQSLNDRSEELIDASRSSTTQYSGVIRETFGISTIESLPITAPLKNFTPPTLLSGFGMRINPFHKGLYNHPGVDFALPRGSEVIAPAAGVVITVKRSDLQAGYGTYLELDHGNGIISRYAHLDDVSVRVGQKVSKGMTIAVTGNSGGSIAPHLHYEITRNGQNVDPVSYLVLDQDPEMFVLLKNISSIQNQSLD